MKKLNINITDDFQKDLESYMNARGIATKPEALRQALREALASSQRKRPDEFREWLGLGLKMPPRQQPRFASEDDLWS